LSTFAVRENIHVLTVRMTTSWSADRHTASRPSNIVDICSYLQQRYAFDDVSLCVSHQDAGIPKVMAEFQWIFRVDSFSLHEMDIFRRNSWNNRDDVLESQWTLCRIT